MSEERFLGINIEYPKTNKAALAGFVAASKIFVRITGVEIVGGFPKERGAIVASNHTSTTNAFSACVACVTTSERIIRGVARESLLDPKIKESDEVLERTGKKDKFDVMNFPLVAQIIAFTLRGIGAIPVQRGSDRNSMQDRKFLTTCDEVIDSGQMLGLFIQETRVKAGDLSNVFPGVGVVARRHQDTPIIPVTILNKRFGNRMIIGDPTSYNELAQEAGKRLGAREVTALVVDRIAANHHPSVNINWQLNDRAKFLSGS